MSAAELRCDICGRSPAMTTDDGLDRCVVHFVFGVDDPDPIAVQMHDLIEPSTRAVPIADPASSPPLHVFVPGRASPQGSKDPLGGGRMRDSSPGLKTWRDSVGWHARQAHARMIPGPVELRLVFVRPRAKAMRDRPAPPATSPPDLDKLERAILDALTGIAYADDAQVTHIDSRKRYATPGEAPGVHLWIQPDYRARTQRTDTESDSDT